VEVLTSDLWTRHLTEVNIGAAVDPALEATIGYILKILCGKYQDTEGFVAQMKDIRKRAKAGSISSIRRAELELLQAGKVSRVNQYKPVKKREPDCTQSCLETDVYFDDYLPFVRQQCDVLYQQHIPGSTPRSTYYGLGINLVETIINGLGHEPVMPATTAADDPNSLEHFFNSMTENFGDGGEFEVMLGPDDLGISSVITEVVTINPSTLEETKPALTAHTELAKPPMFIFTGADVAPSTSGATNSPGSMPSAAAKLEANDCCDICGYRPKGDPQWFKGSMAKHKKLQHATTPPKIYKCPFPGCNSQYKNRPDNLRQHQLDKDHFVEEQGARRPSKRKKTEV
jgi:hypothetical protein